MKWRDGYFLTVAGDNGESALKLFVKLPDSPARSTVPGEY